MRLGGVSDPRNKSLMKMFNLISIGERAGSGVPNIYKIWADEAYLEPVIEELFDPDRTKLTLPFIKKQATKTSDENKRQKQATENKRKKTSDHEQKLREYLDSHGESNTQALADCIGLSPARTRAILAKMPDVIAEGERNKRMYRLQ
jgi:predicted HTH transcriptional regulator